MLAELDRFLAAISPRVGFARFAAIGPADAVSALAQRFPKLVVAKPASGMTLRVVRPDGYVGFADARADRALAEKYLEAIAV